MKDFTWKKQLSIQEWIKSSKEKKKGKEIAAYSDSEWGDQRTKMHRKWEAKLEDSVTKKKKKKTLERSDHLSDVRERNDIGGVGVEVNIEHGWPLRKSFP